MNLLYVFDLCRFIPVVFVLVFAAVQDFKTGEVPNRFWLYIPVGLGLTVIELVFFPSLTVLSIESMGIAVVCAFVFFMFRGWGGADVKATVTIAVSTPLTPLVSHLVTLLPVFALLFAALGGILIITVLNLRKDAEIKFIPLLLVGYVLACFI